MRHQKLWPDKRVQKENTYILMTQIPFLVYLKTSAYSCCSHNFEGFCFITYHCKNVKRRFLLNWAKSLIGNQEITLRETSKLRETKTILYSALESISRDEDIQRVLKRL